MCYRELISIALCIIICYILNTRWRHPLMTIYSLTPRHQLCFYIPNLWRTVVLHLCLCMGHWWPQILTHQPHCHTPNWWRTAVLHLYFCMESWSMSVHMWVLALSTKMCLHTHTTGTVLSVAGQLNKPQHATLWVQWLCSILSFICCTCSVYTDSQLLFFLANVEHFFLGSYLVLQDMKISP